MLRPYNGGHLILREDELGDKQRVAQVWQRVVESLSCVDGSQRG